MNSTDSGPSSFILFQAKAVNRYAEELGQEPRFMLNRQTSGTYDNPRQYRIRITPM